MKYLLILLVLVGCSSAPTIIEREIPVAIPAVRDTAIVLQDTVIYQDTVWVGGITDSLGNIIGDLKVYIAKKLASVNIKPRIDTVRVTDTISVPQNSFLPIVTGVLSWWEQLLLYGGIGIIMSLLIYFRVKRVKIF